MINSAQIPDEVADAVAQLLWEEAGTYPWSRVGEVNKSVYRAKARIAIAAALAAWPGMTHMEPDLANGIIILPLPQQDSDE